MRVLCFEFYVISFLPSVIARNEAIPAQSACFYAEDCFVVPPRNDDAILASGFY